MKKLFIGCLILFAQAAFSQHIEIPIETIKSYRVDKFLIKKDSSISYYSDPIIEVRRFYINFSKTLFDKKKAILYLKGSVCFSADSLNCSGVPGVRIFKAEIDSNNFLNNETELGNTSFNKKSYKKNGFFYFKVKLKDTESIFFSLPYFFVEEYKLGKLLEKEGL